MALITKKTSSGQGELGDPKGFGLSEFPDLKPFPDFVDLSHLLHCYNKKHSGDGKKKTQREINQFMGRKTFFKDVLADFQKEYESGKMDFSYLRVLMGKEEKNDEITQSNSVRDSKKSEDIPLDQISDDAKRSYMIHKIQYNVGRKRYTLVMGNVRVTPHLLKWMKKDHGGERTEQGISDRLAEREDGDREVVVSGGRIDVLTKDEIIEVKSYKQKLHAIGQILYYGKSYPNHQRRIHLYAHENLRNKKYERLCQTLDIRLTYDEN